MWETEEKAQCVWVCVCAHVCVSVSVFGGSKPCKSGHAGLCRVSHVELISALHFEDNLQSVEA